MKGFEDLQNALFMADSAVDKRPENKFAIPFDNFDVGTSSQLFRCPRTSGNFLAKEGETGASFGGWTEAGKLDSGGNIQTEAGFPEIDAAVIVELPGFWGAIDVEEKFPLSSVFWRATLSDAKMSGLSGGLLKEPGGLLAGLFFQAAHDAKTGKQSENVSSRRKGRSPSGNGREMSGKGIFRQGNRIANP